MSGKPPQGGGGIEPLLSAVIVTPDGHRAIERTVEHLRDQTVADRIELVVVGRLDSEADVPGAAGLHSIRTVDFGVIESTGRALAAGFRRARAPLVVCCEEHSFPEPGWAEALIAAHSGPWAAVGVELDNANPGSATSWAHLFSDFGAAVSRTRGGPASELPGHHTAYKRSALQRYGPRLGEMLEQEWVLHDDLRSRGERLYLEPRARASHLNVSRLGANLFSEFHGGREFGAYRARLRSWSFARRLLYVAAAPLIAVVRMVRTLGHVRRSGRADLLPRLLPVLALSLLANCLGQALGYGLGPGRSTRSRIPVELERHRYLNRADRAALAP